MCEVGVEAGQHEELQLGARGLPLVHLQEYHLGGGGVSQIIQRGQTKVKVDKNPAADLLAEDAELVGELLEEEGEELLVLRLGQVVLPLGHVPGSSVRRHHVVGEHLEEGHEDMDREEEAGHEKWKARNGRLKEEEQVLPRGKVGLGP